MPHPVTDQLGIVTQYRVKGNLWERIAGKSVPSRSGFYVVVYAKDSSFRNQAFVQTAKSVKVFDGDIVYEINLGGFPCVIEGSSKTRDGLTRAFTARFKIHVHRDYVIAFWNRYWQNADPAAEAQETIRVTLADWIFDRDDDEIGERARAAMGDLKLALKEKREQHGIDVESIEEVVILPAPHKVKIQEIVFEGEIDLTHVRVGRITDREKHITEQEGIIAKEGDKDIIAFREAFRQRQLRAFNRWMDAVERKIDVYVLAERTQEEMKSQDKDIARYYRILAAPDDRRLPLYLEESQGDSPPDDQAE